MGIKTNIRRLETIAYELQKDGYKPKTVLKDGRLSLQIDAYDEPDEQGELSKLRDKERALSKAEAEFETAINNARTYLGDNIAISRKNNRLSKTDLDTKLSEARRRASDRNFLGQFGIKGRSR